MGPITSKSAIDSALSVLGINVNPLKTKPWDQNRRLRVLKIATKKAFRSRALETHPDHTGGRGDEFKRVANARDLLDSLTPDELDTYLRPPASQRPSWYYSANPWNSWEENVRRDKRRDMVELTLVFHLPVVGR